MWRTPAALALAAACLCDPSATASAQSKGDVGSFDASGRYVFSQSEQKLDCKKLNGRIQVRVMQLRAELADKTQPTGAAQALQQATNPALRLMYGGASGYGTDRASQLRRDRAVLESYNQHLAARNCATYDLDAALRKGPGDPPPVPQPKAAAKQ